jgi:hypothetical protein
VKILFKPMGLVVGLLAGIIARWGARRIWAAFDDREAPGPDQRDASFARLVPWLVLEGAVFRVIKGVVDHGSRRGFERLTGEWPGEREAEPA